MQKIGVGDKVKHKEKNPSALAMEVKKIEQGKCLCKYYDEADESDKEEWFDEAELFGVNSPDTGFKDF